jgi:photosystem I subunit 8
MLGDYAVSFLPVIFVPLLAVAAFASMGLFFIYVEDEAEA